MNDPRGRQATFNASSRDQWDGFAEHRSHVSTLLGAGAARGSTRLCVVGAGNGNDLDLPALLEAHREVHLVDLDAAALELCAGRQAVSGHPGLFLHGPIDVTGMLDALATWTPLTSIGPAELTALANWPASRVAPILPRGFDLVASTCLLTQLMETARHMLGPAHPRLDAVERAIRAGHLRLLARLASPAGRACLITEVVSSGMLPELEQTSKSGLVALLPKMARELNHFRGVHPVEMMAALRDDPELRSLVAACEPSRPWRWRLHDRLYMVWAMNFRVADPRPWSW